MGKDGNWTEKQTNLEPKLLKRLLNIFNVSDNHYYIFNVPLFTFEFVGLDFNISFLIEEFTRRIYPGFWILNLLTF